ncbi:MAG: hypothetical protein LC768_18280 [Acidobacteria bacterium]|nr:hypothetical protein [Acidobacteriota bacterium]MCA1640241.1 hypothetical protein [Acidobacteriota bacterium]
MLQSWIHTKRTFVGSPASEEMRLSTNLSASICANFENSNGYCDLRQPKSGGLNRCELKM